MHIIREACIEAYGSKVIISRFVYVLTILYHLFSICVEEQQNA